MNLDRPRRKKGIALRRMGDECVLYDSEKGSIHIVNAVAASVWEMCDGSRSLVDMERELRAKYAVPDGSAVKADIRTILRDFGSLDAITGDDDDVVERRDPR